jgi:hypothetical protein
MMTRQLGDYASTVHSAVLPLMASTLHTAPKFFVAGLRSLQLMGLPFEGAVAALALGCALAVFLVIWLVLWAIGRFFAALGRGAAGVGRGVASAAAATRNGLSSIKVPTPASLKRSRARSSQPHSQASSLAEEPFEPVWSPATFEEPAAGGSSPAAASAVPARSAPARPTPASIAAPSSGGRPRLADLANPLVQEDVPPGFLFVDTSLSEALAAPASPTPAPRAETGPPPGAVPAAAAPLAQAPVATSPASHNASAPMSIDDAIKFAAELQQTRDRNTLDRMIGRGRPVVTS